MDGNEFQIDQCLSLNFGYIDEELSYSQIVLTPDSETEISFDSSTSCVFVLIGSPCPLDHNALVKWQTTITKQFVRPLTFLRSTKLEAFFNFLYCHGIFL